MTFKTMAIGALTVLAVTLPISAEAADAAAGKKVFKKCAACHKLTAKNGVGPGLAGIIGRKVASTDYKRYSKDFKALGEKGVVWNAETLASFVHMPKKWVASELGKKKAKIRMAFAGVKKQKDVDNLVAFLMENAK